jgi:hypothetical protein
MFCLENARISMKFTNENSLKNQKKWMLFLWRSAVNLQY